MDGEVINIKSKMKDQFLCPITLSQKKNKPTSSKKKPKQKKNG